MRFLEWFCNRFLLWSGIAAWGLIVVLQTDSWHILLIAGIVSGVAIRNALSYGSE
ncbi:unnamed protein product [marine sediment metagenome]|uniref:Uncharacterized protein n=1 Tax=marine sediment metagenome TaxID=412755 RepID=X0TLF9_9ZZZZ